VEAVGYFSAMKSVVVVDTQEGYNKWSETYDTTGNPLVALEDHVLHDLLGPIAGLRVVDLGCGTGRNVRKLFDWGATVTGVDFSEGMLQKARAAVRGADFVQHDLNKRLPFADDSFDLVLSSLVIEHIQNLTPLFIEMGRICAKGGRIVISDLHPAMHLKDAQAQFTDKATGADIRPRGFPHTMSEYMLAIRDSGLQLEDVKEFAGNAGLAERFPKMEKYIGWPMLVVFKLRAAVN
jgi:SAM-dependent methyltransferase